MRHSITQITRDKYGGTFKASLQVPMEKGWIDHVKFYIWRNEEHHEIEMKYVRKDEKYAYFETRHFYLSSCPIYHYYFSFQANGQFEHYKKENRTGNECVRKVECFKGSVNFDVPDKAKGCVAYQIFPDRFRQGKNSVKKPMPRRHLHENWDEQPVLGPDEQGIYNNDFFGGDFAGIEEAVEYIADLGVDAVYYNPIVTSQSTHRYDTADYFRPDPYLGTVEELKRLNDKFHEHGIKVIFDGVFNHTGNDSVYYNQYGTYQSVGAYQNPQSPYREFYEWDENGKAHGWWDFENMPTCNKHNPKFIDMICGVGGVIDTWCSWGMDGIRLDVMDELPDSFIKEIHNAMQRSNPDNFVIWGEVWENAMRKGRAYIDPEEAHSFMNYFLTDGLLRYYMYEDIYKLERVFCEIQEDYPPETLLTAMNSTSTHDTSRCINLCGSDVFYYYGQYYWDIDWNKILNEKKWTNLLREEKRKCREQGKSESKAYDKVKEEWQKSYNLSKEQYEHGKKVMKSYVTSLAFMPGMFTVFYGDEVGLQGIGNLINRSTYPWGHEDLELLEFYKRLIKSRKSEEFLRKADVRILEISTEHLVFERYDDNNKAIVIASRVAYPTEISIPAEYKDGKIVFSIEGSSEEKLTPYGAIVIKK